MPKIRVVTYNIHGWKALDGTLNLEPVVRVLSGCGADVIGLNEVFHPQTVVPEEHRGLTLKTRKPLLQELAEQLDYEYVFGPVLRWAATETLPERSYGNAILSRYPIIASAAHRLTSVDGKEDRGVLEGRLLLEDGRTLTVYVTHLDHTDEETRMVQLRALRSWTGRDRRRDHLLLGDFNAIQPEDYTHRPQELTTLSRHPQAGHLVPEATGPQVIPALENAGYIDTALLKGSPGQGSYIPAETPLRIDYVWVSQSLGERVVGAGVWQEEPGNEASDHRPVWADVDLEEHGSI